MVHDSNKGKGPAVNKVGVAPVAATLADAAATQMGGKAEAVKNKAEQVSQGITQVSAVAEQFNALGANGQSARARSTGIAGPFGYPAAAEAPVPKGPSRPSNAAAIIANEIFGVNHLAKLVIAVEGKHIPHFKDFQLKQSAVGHHHFSLTLDHDSLGIPEDHQMENVQKLMGKRILVTFSYKNIPTGSPERYFIGVITKVGYSRKHGNHGNIILKGSSPTVLLDAAPHIQSFGGTEVVSLSAVASRMLEDGLGDKYPFRVDPNYKDNLRYTCQYDETYYNYLARMAVAYGEQFYYDGYTLHFGKLPPPEKAITLTFGKDVEDIEIELRTRHVNRHMYGYNSSTDELLTVGETKITHQSSLAKAAYAISEKTYHTASLRMAPMKAVTSKHIEAAQQSNMGREAVNVFVTSGRTTVPFLYPGCVVDMNMRKPDSAEASYLTRLMITEVSHSVDILGKYSATFEAIAQGTGFLPAPEYRMPIAEPQIAKVINNQDEQGRVKVRFDWQTGGTTTEWIRMMSPDAGGSDKVNKNRGFVAIPEVGDQVLIGFMFNHPDRPYVMGGLFHGNVGAGGGAGNNIKSLSSKSGHIVELNDGVGITVRDKAGNIITLDGTGEAKVKSNDIIKLECGDSSIEMDKAGNITISGKNIIIIGNNIGALAKESAGIAVDNKSGITVLPESVEVATSGIATISATSETNVGGGAVNIGADGDIKIVGGKVKLN